MRRWALIAATPVLSVFLGATAIAIIAALTANACPTPTGGTGDQPSATAIGQIPAQLLAIYEQVGARYDLPWEILAGIATEECDQGRLPDPSCTLQPGATGPGIANPAGASGLMQIGIGGAAGDAYDQLRQYLPNPALGPHDPTTAVQLAALVLIKDKGAPTGQPINAYLPYAAAYNGTGPAATAYATRVIADANTYQGTGQTTFVGLSSGGCSPPVSDTGYVNPFAHAQVTPSRIDQGVDYSGTGPIDALGPGRVVLVSTDDTGWGNGNGWISYQLTAGTYAGDYVYVAEGITPNRPRRRDALRGRADRLVQRPLDRNRIRARPRRPRPRPHRLPRRRRHRRRTRHERATHLPRRGRRAPGPHQLRRTMSDPRRTSALERLEPPPSRDLALNARLPHETKSHRTWPRRS